MAANGTPRAHHPGSRRSPQHGAVLPAGLRLEGHGGGADLRGAGAARGHEAGAVPARWLPAQHAAPGPQHDQTSSTELYLYPDDLEATSRKVLASGGRQLDALAARDWGDDAAYYADPEGNVVVLARRR